MTEPNQLTYAAIITIDLPGMEQPTTVTVTLTPQTLVEMPSGQVKPLRDCTLAELQASVEALESELWAPYREDNLGELAAGTDSAVQITILDERGQSRRLDPDTWPEHAIVLDRPAGGTSSVDSAPERGEEAPVDEAEPAALLGAEGETESTATANADTTPAETTQVRDEAEGDLTGAEAAPALPAAPAETVEAEAAPEDEEGSAAETEESGPPVTAAGPQAELEAATEESAVAAQQVEPEVAAAPPEETPVIAGTEPQPAPVELEAEVAPSKIRIAGLRRPIGHPTPAAVDILINEPAFRDTQAHALSTVDREVAGMLIGPPPEKQPDGRYVVHITDAIIAKHTRMHGASVTYTPESWRHVTDVLQARYPKEEAIIVGWYHTHPGFGIFLSGMDLFIHQNFFTQKWHIAFVLDPLARRSGFFCWDRGQQRVQAYDFPWPPWAQNAW